MHENYIALSQYRLEHALDDYVAATHAFSGGHYRNTINRAYYCIFHTMRSLLILNGLDYKKHSGVIAAFQKEYIKTGVFGTEYSKIITGASMLRNCSDYDDMYFISKDEAKQQLDNAKFFYDGIKPYIENLIAGF